MRKTILITLFVFIASRSFAAGTCAWQSTTDVNDGVDTVGSVVTLLCTHHTDNSLSVELSSSTMSELAGKYVFAVKSYPGSTAPTDATDLSIADSDGLSLMGVADNGLNFIDATSTLATMFYNSNLSTNMYWLPIDGEAWTISTANNAVASATFYLKFYLVR